eukprot:scaffold36066_cov52-Attheya_sp.AAC.1
MRLMFVRDVTARCRAKEYMDRATAQVKLDPRGYFQMSTDNLQWKDNDCPKPEVASGMFLHMAVL